MHRIKAPIVTFTSHITIPWFIKDILKILLLCVLVLSVVTMITSRTDKLGGLRSFVVLSGSMEPLLPVGSMIFVSPTFPYKSGDVIAFQNSAGQTVTHRIIEKINQGHVIGYKLQGDANKSPDTEIIPEGQVLGKQFFTIPYIGFFISYLRTVQGFAVFILFPTLVYVGLELWNIKKEIVKETERKLMEKFGNMHANPEQVASL